MTTGIHHITAIASKAQENVDFYTKVLGLRLVKKTVNQDDISTYHLFFGDKTGAPGMDLTFFIFTPPMQGMRGNGLVTTISLAVPQNSLSFWQKRFDDLNVKHNKLSSRFGHDRIVFFDADNQQLELVGVDEKALEDTGEIWTTPEISKKEAIRQFHSATLSVENLKTIEPVLTHVFGYSQIEQDQQTYLFQVPNSKRAELLEVSETPSLKLGFNAAGTVHHIAFRAKSEVHQQELRNKVLEIGLYPTEVINRYYFKSVYFRTRAGILFEIATDGPGFTVNESEKDLGRKLDLPPFLEKERHFIENNLPQITTDV
ncbi:VOC family protein [Patescibacteria group bacterium]|nr:VOC family protein [Patescibacteria group bacterium]